MGFEENTYCRLCANLKSNTKLVNLQWDEKEKYKIIEKLRRLNLNIELNDKSLPNTICYPCISTLEKSFNFVIDVEKAQEYLQSAVLNHVKTENVSIEDENSCFSPTHVECDVSVKVEGENGNSSSIVSNRIELDNVDVKSESQPKTTWKDYTWQCAYCDTQFPTLEELQLHAIKYHECCNAYKCTDCNLRKLKLDTFISHVKSHRKYLKLSCYICFTNFPNNFGSKFLSAHNSTHRKTNFICTGCNSCFKTAKELNQHSSALNRDKKKRPIPKVQDLNDLTCMFCQKIFKQRKNLLSHLLIHTERKRDYTCEKCGKCFFDKHNLAGHMSLHDDVRPFQCDICKFRFKTAGHLRSHISKHDGIKPFACDQCGKSFRLNKALTSHKRVHTDILPYSCTYCSKSFRFKPLLTQHIRQHTGVKPYTCQFCQRDFTNGSNYSKHMKRRHSEMTTKKYSYEDVSGGATGETLDTIESDQIVQCKKNVHSQHQSADQTKLDQSNHIDSIETKILPMVNAENVISHNL